LNQVEDLLKYTNQLLIMLEMESLDDTEYEKIFLQTKFYLDLEFLRANAGWLLDENNIHTPVYNRVTLQLYTLNEIGRNAEIDLSLLPSPLTDVQKQCEHDSYAIAHKILDLAIQLKNNPEMELDKVPEHAQKIIRKHAKPDGRYHNDDIFLGITNLHDKSTSFLEKSLLSTSTNLFSKEDIIQKASQHKATFAEYMQRYEKIAPNSTLFASDHKWYDVAKNPTNKNTSKYPGFFGTAACITFALSMYALFYFLNLSQGSALTNTSLKNGL
jgi:hypothetical protein